MARSRKALVCFTLLFAGCSLVVDAKIDDHEGRTDAGPVTIDSGSRDTGSRADGGREDARADEDAGLDPDAAADVDAGAEDDAGGTPDAGTDAGPSCAGTCVPEVPSGWTGPVALFTAAPSASAPACTAPYPTTAGAYFGDLDPGAVSCGCTCDPATGIACSGNVRLCYGSGTFFCTMACLSTVTGPAVGGGCSPVSPSGDRAQIFPPTPTSHGSCAPRDAHTMVAPTWSTQAKACGGATTSAAGCAAGETCAPVASAAFDEVCIATSGDVACPATGTGGYTERHLFYESFTDTRTCSACSCGSATSTCGGRVNFVNDACTIVTGTVTGCGLHGGGTRADYAPTPTGSCPPSASSMTGTVTRNGAVTYCCLP